MTSDPSDVGAFGAAFVRFMDSMREAADQRESPVHARLAAHLGVDPAELPSTTSQYAAPDHPNLQLALDVTLPEAEVIGLSQGRGMRQVVGFAELLDGDRGLRPSPTVYEDLEVGDGRVVRCLSSALLLDRWEEAPIALLLSSGQSPPFGQEELVIGVVSPDSEVPSRLVRAIREAMREHNVYRGRVIAFHQTPPRGGVTVRFPVVADVRREAVILPEGVLERLERHTIGVSAQRERLSAGGRHLKRGILLHGPPGTGKTHTVSYLIGSMPGRTTVILTGQGLGLVEQATTVARALAPSTVVLEDVDLIAAERTMPFGHGGALADLLNQMEGLDADEDLLFVLTTNRPDVIEPALAARPGRVDLALEVPLPDAAARRRLLALYATDIPLDTVAEQRVVDATDGVTGAFVKELVRQAALRAALDGRDTAGAADLESALAELLDERATLTRRLLGQGAGEQPGEPVAGPGLLPSPAAVAMLRATASAGLHRSR